jgi:hypothetical protein
MSSKQVGQINYSKITNPVNIYSKNVRNFATQVHKFTPLKDRSAVPSK